MKKQWRGEIFGIHRALKAVGYSHAETSCVVARLWEIPAPRPFPKEVKPHGEMVNRLLPQLIEECDAKYE